jgi:cytoskeleton protein RodZ
MTEALGTAAPLEAPSAGRLLRAARERQGLHIAALAASIKVTQKKLELLEADRFDALPDATFTRALAQTVCRALKIDHVAVLGLLPPPASHRLEQVGEGLNAPFRERPGASVQGDGSSFTFNAVFWGTTLVLVAAAVLYFLPSGWLSMLGWRKDGTATTPAVVEAAPASALPLPTMASAPVLATPPDRLTDAAARQESPSSAAAPVGSSIDDEPPFPAAERRPSDPPIPFK